MQQFKNSKICISRTRMVATFVGGKNRMKLEFQMENNEIEVISHPRNKLELWRDIHKVLEDMGFKTYYQRLYIENNKLKIDFGSHTEFFYVTDLTVSDLRELSIEIIN